MMQLLRAKRPEPTQAGDDTIESVLMELCEYGDPALRRSRTDG